MPSFQGELRVQDGVRFTLIASRWNPRIVDALIAGAQRALVDNGVAAEAIDLIRVPGAWEIPQMAARLAKRRECVVIIALGCVVRGETRHYEHVADGCAHGLMQVALEYDLPVLNGVLAVEQYADAQARAGGVQGNKGEEVALAALEMADLCRILAPSA